MNREQAIEIARSVAKPMLEGYEEPFDPADWVVAAIMAGASVGAKAAVADSTATVDLDLVVELRALRTLNEDLQAKIANYEAAAPSVVAMEFIRSGIQMAVLLARPVEEGGPENMTARIAWDVPIQGCYFQLVELSFVRPGARGPHEMREAAEAAMVEARDVLRSTLVWLEAAAGVDEVVEDVGDRNELRAVTRDVRRLLAAPPPKPVKVTPTESELRAMARLLYEAPEKDGTPADHHVPWDDVPEDDMVFECMMNEARLAFALGARLPS